MCCPVRLPTAHPDDHALLPGPYLNASRIPPLPESTPDARACIASQAPTVGTFGTFYHHLCTEQVGTLLNLTPLAEGQIVKSHAYWPSSTSEPLHVEPGWTVELLWERESTDADTDGLTWRRLRLQPADGDAHELTLLHYTGWRDHGPLPMPQLLALLAEVHTACQATPSGAPLWVHCSAGIGRSGTLIGVVLAEQLAPDAFADASSMDLAVHITKYLREFRGGMVQTPGQLVTLAHAIEHVRQTKH